eukprot:maker-scaffold134_size322110-snap-gene-1.12 protein:Tk07175 transcript:maker-scaffold134_size322110-snap-gene-1.12-mRNA-1 annotation:"phosphatidylinositol transfer protein beta isoform"
MSESSQTTRPEPGWPLPPTEPGLTAGEWILAAAKGQLSESGPALDRGLRVPNVPIVPNVRFLFPAMPDSGADANPPAGYDYYGPELGGVGGYLPWGGREAGPHSYRYQSGAAQGPQTGYWPAYPPPLGALAPPPGPESVATTCTTGLSRESSRDDLTSLMDGRIFDYEERFRVDRRKLELLMLGLEELGLGVNHLGGILNGLRSCIWLDIPEITRCHVGNGRRLQSHGNTIWLDDAELILGLEGQRNSLVVEVAELILRLVGHGNSLVVEVAELILGLEGQGNSLVVEVAELILRLIFEYRNPRVEWHNKRGQQSIHQDCKVLMSICQLVGERGSLTANSLAANSLAANSLATNSLATNSLAANSHTANSLTANSLTANSLTANSLAANSLAANSLAANSLAANSLAANSLAANSLTGNSLTGNGLTGNGLTGNGLTGNGLTANSLTANSLTAKSLTANSLTANSLTANSLTANSLTANSLAANSLAANSLAANSLATNSLATNSLAANSLTANSLTANSLTANSLAANSLAANSLAANSFAANSLMGNSLTRNSLMGNSLTANGLTANGLTANSLTAKSLTANSLTAINLTAGILLGSLELESSLALVATSSMKTRELRIPLPMTVDDYLIAQNWSFNEQSRRETGGGEGVEIVKNEAFSGTPFLGGKYSSGQYTYKIYHVETKVPTIVRALIKPIIGKKGFQLHEEAWNCYPYCKTVISNPGYMKNDFKVILESIHLNDVGDTPNALGLDPEDYKNMNMVTLDIAADKCSLRDKDCDPVSYQSKKANVGPLNPKSWRKDTQPIMTCYKFITVHFKWFGLQSKMENLLLDQYTKMLLGFHQQVWCWTDEWHGLTLEDIRALEDKTKDELQDQIKESGKRGITNFD